MDWVSEYGKQRCVHLFMVPDDGNGTERKPSIVAVLSMAQGRMFGLAAFALVWGAIVAVLGFTQQDLLPGEFHWIVRVLHLIIGMASVPIAEGLVPRPVRVAA